MHSRFINIFFGVILFCSSFSGFAQPQTQVIEKIVARVNDEIVLLSDLKNAAARYRMQGMAVDEGTECQLLESMVVNKMMTAKAEIDSVDVDAQMVQQTVDQKMEEMMKQRGWTAKDVFENLGKTVDQYKEELRPIIRDELTVQKMQQEITSDITATPAEVKKFYKKIPKDSLPYFSTEVEIGKIVVLPKVNTKEKERALNEIQEIRRKILGGDDFGIWARQKSEDELSAIQDGEVGWFTRGQLMPAYEAASMRLKPGEYSDIVETPFGYHFIQLIDRKGNEYNTRHILIRPKKTGDDLERSKEFLDSVRSLIVSDSITFEKAAFEFSDDPSTKNGGGYVKDPQSGSNRVPMEQIDHNLFFIIDTMRLGSISKPIEVTAYNNEKAAAIIYFKSKTRAHIANLKNDYQKLYRYTLISKKNEALNGWFEKVKNELYLNIDEDYHACGILER